MKILSSFIISSAFFLLLFPLPASAKSPPPFFAKSSKNISLLCERRCPFTRKKLEKAFVNLDRQFERMEEKTGIPFPENLKPVEIHLRYNKSCRKVSKGLTDDPEVFGFTVAKPDGKAIVCIKLDINDILQNRPTYILHEYAHHYFPMRVQGKYDFEETLADAFTQFLTGKPGSFCSPINEKFEPEIYALCRDDGLEVDDIPELIRRLNALKENGVVVTNEMAKVEIRKIGTENR